MEKATRAIRRSGVRFKSMNSGHTDIALIISGIRDMRIGLKSFQSSQAEVVQDLLVWSHTDENRAIQDVMEQLNELQNSWADSQKEFNEHLKTLRHHFEMILDGEKEVDVSRNNLAVAEQREHKIKKELKKTAKKASVEELVSLEMKLADAERAKDLAQYEAVEKIQENEACKLIRLKEGLTKLSEGYLEMAHKMAIVFEAQREVVQALPDVHSTAIHELKYTGGGETKKAVQRARTRLQRYDVRKFKLVPAGGIDDPPPPYTPGFFDTVPDSMSHDPNQGDVRNRRPEPRAPPPERTPCCEASRAYSSEEEEDLQKLGAHKL